MSERLATLANDGWARLALAQPTYAKLVHGREWRIVKPHKAPWRVTGDEVDLGSVGLSNPVPWRKANVLIERWEVQERRRDQRLVSNRSSVDALLVLLRIESLKKLVAEAEREYQDLQD